MTAPTVRVETFGLIRPGQIDDVPIDRLAAHLDRLRAEDREFFEVLDPVPGDLVRILGPYYAVRDLEPNAPGRLAVIDGSHYGWDLENGRGPIVLAVLAYSCFWGPSISRRDPADDGPSYVSASGGPCPFIPLAELEPAGTTEGHYWRWESMPCAGGGRPYTRTVNLWTWAYDPDRDPTKGA